MATSQKAVRKYEKKHYDQKRLLLYKGDNDTLKAVATAEHVSVNCLIVTAINDWLRANGYSPLMSAEKKLKKSVLDALDEADRIAYDDSVKSYTSEELFAEWDREDREDDEV